MSINIIYIVSVLIKTLFFQTEKKLSASSWNPLIFFFERCLNLMAFFIPMAFFNTMVFFRSREFLQDFLSKIFILELNCCRRRPSRTFPGRSRVSRMLPGRVTLYVDLRTMDFPRAIPNFHLRIF